MADMNQLQTISIGIFGRTISNQYSLLLVFVNCKSMKSSSADSHQGLTSASQSFFQGYSHYHCFEDPNDQIGEIMAKTLTRG